jgi:polyphosphate kinase
VDSTTTRPADRYINRELSLLEFNRRVLAQAADTTLPILERLRFLCISCTNLDEFFEIRVASFKQLFEIDAPAQGPDELTPGQILAEIRKQTLVLIQRQYQLLNEEILPSLANEQIFFPQRHKWNKDQKLWL